MIDWSSLVRAEGPRVWRIAYRLLGNHADAADCFQETFAAALHVSRREGVTHWPGLMRRLATVQALHRLRRRYRDKMEVMPEGWDAVAPEPGPLEQAEASELAGGLRVALASLGDQEGAVFCLRCLEDLSYQEIAEQLQLDVSTVGVILHRARARLRKLLAAFLPKAT
jgi:RNA polymerase sigma-70 factor (ECF subfamily)